MTSGADAVHRHRAAVRARLRASGHARPAPGSVTWKINREMIVVAGWGRAIVFLLAHPAVAAGVHDHSSFRQGALSRASRLRATVRAMLALTFGDTEQMIAAAAGINTIHDHIRGRDGRRDAYSAHDPELLRWVHATLVDSILVTYERLVGPLTPHERDQYCAEASIMEPLLGMPAGWLPRDTAGLYAYIERMLASGGVEVSDTSRLLARAVLYPPRWRMVWPVFRPMQLMTIGSLPPPVRDAYGFAWRARDARSLARWTRFLRALLRRLPKVAREWPIARRQQQQRHHRELTTCRSIESRPGLR